MSERHQPKHFVEAAKDTCTYCHRTPAIWQHSGDEKVCMHCGTRHSNPGVSTPAQISGAKPVER